MVKLRFSDTGAWKTKNGIIGWRNRETDEQFLQPCRIGIDSQDKTRQDIITPRLVSN
jgi:hypothetical protein